MNEPSELPAFGDRCPRCGDSFHCGVSDATPCACTTLRLDEETLRKLGQGFSGCLCLRCLQAFAIPDPNYKSSVD